MNFDNLKITKKIKEIEKELTSSNKLKLLKKCHPIDRMVDWYSIQNEKGGGGGGGSRGWEQVISSCFLFFIVFILFVKKIFVLLSCFINFIFNSFVISYWIYFVVIERKKIIRKLLVFFNLTVKISCCTV